MTVTVDGSGVGVGVGSAVVVAVGAVVATSQVTIRMTASTKNRHETTEPM